MKSEEPYEMDILGSGWLSITSAYVAWLLPSSLISLSRDTTFCFSKSAAEGPCWLAGLNPSRQWTWSVCSRGGGREEEGPLFVGYIVMLLELEPWLCT
jgi:hypothetical protein